MEEQNTTEQQTSEQQNEAPQAPAAVSSDDVEKNKAMAIIGYIIPILFFIPLVTEAKDSVYAKFHANQQLILLIASIGVSVVGSIIPILGWFITSLSQSMEEKLGWTTTSTLYHTRL